MPESSETTTSSQGAKLATRVYYLKPNDGIVSVIDRLAWAKAPRIALVISPETPVLMAELDLFRLRRAAAQFDVQVALVTIDPDQRSAARKLGIPAYLSLDRALHSRWRHRPRQGLECPVRDAQHQDPHQFQPHSSQLSGFVLMGGLIGVALAVALSLLSAVTLSWKPLLKEIFIGAAFGCVMGGLTFLLAWILRRWLPRGFRWVRFAFMALVFALGLVAPVGAGYLIVPQARLTLTPATVKVSIIARVTVVVPLPGEEGLTQIDYEGLRISGRRLASTVTGEASIATSGQTQVPSSRATGTIVFTNILAQSYTVARGTTVRTTAGTPVRFETLGDVTVPPLGQAAVGVTAMEPGPEGNVGVGMINQIEGVASRALRVTNPEPTHGGGVSHVKAVTQADREALRRALLGQLRGLGLERLEELRPEEGGLQEGEILLVDSVRVHARDVDMAYNRFVGERADSLTLEMRASVTGIAVDRADALNLARHVLLQKVPPNYELDEEQEHYGIGLMGDNILGEGTLTFFVEAQGVATADLDTAQIKKAIRGKSLEDALARLEIDLRTGALPAREMPAIEIWPGWAADRLPWLVWRIEIELPGG